MIFPDDPNAKNDDSEDGRGGSSDLGSDVEADVVPATEIVKAARKAKKKGSKKKTAAKKAAPAKKGASRKPSSRPSKPVSKKSSKKPDGASKRGPKGNAPADVRRTGDAAYGKKVRAARDAKGLTGRALAAKLGVTQPAICNIEKGTLGAGIEMQKLLKKALGVPLSKACEAAIAEGRKFVTARGKK